MTISIIVAMAENRAIGRNGDLIWHNSRDLKQFKKITSGHTVIMGYKTYMSLPGQKALPNRRNIILSTRLDKAPEGFEVVSSIAQALDAVKDEVSILHASASVLKPTPISLTSTSKNGISSTLKSLTTTRRWIIPTASKCGNGLKSNKPYPSKQQKKRLPRTRGNRFWF